MQMLNGYHPWLMTAHHEGVGEVAAAGAEVAIHYTAWLYDAKAAGNKGEQILDSRRDGAPVRFRLGTGEVIRGWEEALAGLRAGSRCTLLVPPNYAFGSEGDGGRVPPYATLVYEIELLEVA